MFTLSYVNTKDETYHYDKEFDTIIMLMSFVNRNHPDNTSYQIIVTR